MLTLFIILGVLVMLVVLGLTIYAISSGYSYKHTIDPVDPPSLPEKIKREEEKKDLR